MASVFEFFADGVSSIVTGLLSVGSASGVPFLPIPVSYTHLVRYTLYPMICPASFI